MFHYYNMRSSLRSSAIIFFLAFMSLYSCKEVVLTPKHVNPLYSSLDKYYSLNTNQRDSLLKSDSTEIYIMMKYLGYDFVWENPSVTAGEEQNDSNKINIHKKKTSTNNVDSLPTINEILEKWSRSKSIELYTNAVDEVYPSLESFENTLGLILENAKNEDINIPSYKYVGVVWDSPHSIIFSDSIVFIAFNHFLGEDFPAYKMEKYRKIDKTPQQLPYAVAEALLGTNFPYKPTENATALSRMMYEGAMTYIKLKIVPGATLASTLGYTTEQLEWLDHHYQQMWEIMIGKDILYTTSQLTINKLVSPAPSTNIIDPDSPGRAGRYLGYRLVLNYVVNNAKTPISYLLSPDFYNNPSELVLAQ